MRCACFAHACSFQPDDSAQHAILGELKKVKSQLSFAIPETLPALKDGNSHVKLSNGAEASMFKLIPGVLPKLTCVKAIGVATGELTRAMYGVKLDMQSPTAPYYDIYKVADGLRVEGSSHLSALNPFSQVHHAVSREKFFEVVAGSDFDGVRGATDYLVSELRKVETALEEYHALQLPMSWIHGDLRACPARLRGRLPRANSRTQSRL